MKLRGGREWRQEENIISESTHTAFCGTHCLHTAGKTCTAWTASAYGYISLCSALYARLELDSSVYFKWGTAIYGTGGKDDMQQE